MKKFKEKIMVLLPMLFFMIIGAACGILIVRYTDAVWGAESIGKGLCMALVLLLLMYLVIILQIMIHEGGHLIFGLLTGYRFSSFRIGSLMWVKRDGKLHFSRLSLAGTGGQCLLIPPDMVDGRYPYFLYNMGGSLLNLLSAALCVGIAVLCPHASPVFVLLRMMAVIGVAFALMNGIPMRLGTVDNDGYNAFSIGKKPESLRAFWIQMKVNQQVASGIRLRDMTEEWFGMPADGEMKNSMVATLGVFACNRLMDEQRFAEADQEMERLLSMDTAIVGVHRSLMTIDMVFCELVGENRKERLERLLDKTQKKFMKMMKKYPSVLRTEYVYALLAEKDSAKAERIRKSFEKQGRKYPYPSEIKAERELMEYADSVWKAHEASC